MLLPRARHVSAVRGLLDQFPVVAIIGARQVGKSTLARLVAPDQATFFDLEDERDRSRLQDPMLALEPLEGVVVLDEVQRLPDVFTTLRVLADRRNARAQFLVLGSAGPELLRQSSESLAGRIAYYPLGGFSLDEVPVDARNQLWVRGGFPRSYLASAEGRSVVWRRQFIRTFLERDLPQLGVGVPAETMRRFWSMLAHIHGQTLNASALGRSLGVSDTTVRRYLDHLCGTFVVRQLHPWFENLGKRQIKSPKVFVADTGLLHALLGLDSRVALEGHPQVGASWELFVVDNVLARLGVAWEDAHFWGIHAGAEIDLVVMRGSRRLGFEVKRTSAPRVTPSMRTALDDLALDRIEVLYPGDETYPMADRVWARPVRRIWEDLEPL